MVRGLEKGGVTPLSVSWFLSSSRLSLSLFAVIQREALLWIAKNPYTHIHVARGGGDPSFLSKFNISNWGWRELGPPPLASLSSWQPTPPLVSLRNGESRKSTSSPSPFRLLRPPTLLSARPVANHFFASFTLSLPRYFVACGGGGGNHRLSSPLCFLPWPRYGRGGARQE